MKYLVALFFVLIPVSLTSCYRIYALSEAQNCTEYNLKVFIHFDNEIKEVSMVPRETVRIPPSRLITKICIINQNDKFFFDNLRQHIPLQEKVRRERFWNFPTLHPCLVTDIFIRENTNNGIYLQGIKRDGNNWQINPSKEL